MSTPTADNIERRFHTRHRARTMVQIRSAQGNKRMCKAINLSADGVGVETKGMGLKKNEEVELTFVINLGSISKMHHRKGRVVHVKNGITGFAMQRYEPPKARTV